MTPPRSTALILLAALAAAPVHAAAAGEQSLEIVVTAQRRSETALSVPAAITAFDQSFLDRTELDDIKDLVTFTPGFSGNSNDSFIDGLAVRGIASSDYGIGGDPSIGIFKDGVYQGRTGAAVTSVFDLERAEALRGPQGFLFGRNAISGAISVITNKPSTDATSGHLYLGYGEVDRKEGEVALNLPLGGAFALRLAGYATDFDGWVDNANTPGNDRIMGGNKQAGRVSLLYAGEGVRAALIGEHERRRLDGTPYRASNNDREVLDYLSEALGEPVVVRGGPGDVDTDLIRPQDRGNVSSASLLIDADLPFATLNAISAWRRHRFFYSEDYDGTALPLGNYTQAQRGTYLSQEVRLVSPDAGAFTWSAGLSGYRETVRARFTNEAGEDAVCRAGFGYADCDALTQDLYGVGYVPASGGLLVDVNDARSRNTGLSGFADLNYRPARAIQLGAGLRYSWDRKRFTLDVLPSARTLGNIWTFPYFTEGPVRDARSWSGLTPRVYARWTPRADLSLYASVMRGYKAGGYGSFTVDAPSPIEDYGAVPAGTRPDAFAPETIWSKEAGIKGFAFDRLLSFDVTAFHYIYRNLQTVFFDTDTRTQQVINVGRVRGQGVEAALGLRLGRRFDVSGNVTWTDTKKSGDRDCTSRDCGGLLNPRWASSGIATFHQPLPLGEAYLQGEWSYQGHRRESYDWRGITRRPAYTEVNLRLGLRSDKGWELILYVQNLLDQRRYRGVENGGDLTPATVWGVTQPRNVGVDLRTRF
ncbi:TonB-dependent receptor [Sphingomonas jatrophae]|uniref:Iron complex outermembrane recepter protein n=1 Tax=Sphingomonas jatrophae TaxID=1166337 RepID=A0A1I6JF70_9SPHN|nr:TonB-dependent receptor [Sphingomonas jatrophae]SFR77514.1 iron complex outermembrane recepter protein [Sphingomonas jatrophae]